MDIKQQVLANHDNKYIHLVDEVGDVVTTDQGMRIKCVGKTSTGEPIWDKCKF